MRGAKTQTNRWHAHYPTVCGRLSPSLTVPAALTAIQRQPFVNPRAQVAELSGRCVHETWRVIVGNIQGDGGVSVMQQPESKAYIAYAASDAVATLVLGVFQLLSGFEPVLDELRTRRDHAEWQREWKNYERMRMNPWGWYHAVEPLQGPPGAVTAQPSKRRLETRAEWRNLASDLADRLFS